MKKKKVMHVLNTGSYSGAENVVITLINATKSDVDAVYVSLDGPIQEYLEENNIEFEPVRKLSISEIKRVIKKVDPDIVHAHDFTAGIICSLSTNRPIINHIHNNAPWIKHYNLKSFAYAFSCLKYNKILTVSNSVMEEYVFGKWFKNKSVVVGNPVDLERIKRLSGEAVIKYDIAFLGRLTPAKNPELFLNIIEEVKKSKNDVSVIMIGDGELRDDVKRRIRDFNLQDNVTLIGFQKNPYKYLNQAKILLMPSSWEGYGLAAVEALALGKPVVCSNAGGLPGIVNDSCGKVCESKGEYVHVIGSLLVDEKNYKIYAEAARERADEVGCMKGYVANILGVYEL